MILFLVMDWRRLLVVTKRRFLLQIWRNFRHSFVSTKFHFFTEPAQIQALNPFLQSAYYLKTAWNQSNHLWRTLTKFLLKSTLMKPIQVISATIQALSSTFAIDYCQFAIQLVVTSSLFGLYQRKIQPQNLLLQFFKFLKSEAVQMFLSLYFVAVCLPDCLSRTFQIGSLQILTTALNFMARERKIDFFKSIQGSFQMLKKCGSTWKGLISFTI